MRIRMMRCLLLAILWTHSLTAVALPTTADQVAHQSQLDTLDKAFQRLDES
jgi:hypothetical protein